MTTSSNSSVKRSGMPNHCCDPRQHPSSKWQPINRSMYLVPASFPAWGLIHVLEATLLRQEIDGKHFTALVYFSSVKTRFLSAQPAAAEHQRASEGQLARGRLYALHPFCSLADVRTRHARHFGSILRASWHIGNLCT